MRRKDFLWRLPVCVLISRTRRIHQGRFVSARGLLSPIRSLAGICYMVIAVILPRGKIVLLSLFWIAFMTGSTRGKLKIESWRRGSGEWKFGKGMINCYLSLCSFLAHVGKKRTKETPLKGKRCFKSRQIVSEIKPFVNAELFAILSPLRIPLSSARL